jgi:hypothetical protein
MNLKTIAALLAVSASVPAFATIVVNPVNNNQDIDNVLFNAPLLHDGPLVQGDFNGSGAGFIVDFTSTGGNLHGGGGQATVTGTGANEEFSNVTIALEAGATFTRLVVNPDATVDGTINFTVNYITPSGQQTFIGLALKGSGENFYTVDASGGDRITSVTLDAVDSKFVNLQQVRLGGFAPETSVPDGGATVALLGLGSLALATFRRKA